MCHTILNTQNRSTKQYGTMNQKICVFSMVCHGTWYEEIQSIHAQVKHSAEDDPNLTAHTDNMLFQYESTYFRHTLMYMYTKIVRY